MRKTGEENSLRRRKDEKVKREEIQSERKLAKWGFHEEEEGWYQ